MPFRPAERVAQAFAYGTSNFFADAPKILKDALERLAKVFQVAPDPHMHARLAPPPPKRPSAPPHLDARPADL